MTRYHAAPDADREPTIWREGLTPTHHRHEGDAYSVVPGPPHTCIAPVKCEGVVVLTPAEVAQMLAQAWEQGRAAGAALFPAQADENPWGVL